MKNRITIGPGTEIDLQSLIESRLLIQANSGGGKSGVARVIMEESFKTVPFIVLDKSGEYYTLKELHGDIIIIGGQYQDVPLSMQAAKMLPKMIIENRLSVIIDMSGEGMDNETRMNFVRDFLHALMNLPQKYWINYLIFIEEAHIFCGQQDKHPCGKYVKQLMSEGRKMGYCGILITQRISKLHKDAAAEANNKFIGRTFLDIDMDRSASEMGFSRKEDKLKLRDLKPRHFYAFGTSITPIHVHEVAIRPAKTKFPKVGSDLSIKPQKPTPKLLQMMEKLNDLPSAVKKENNDIFSLKEENKSLRLQVDKLKKENETDDQRLVQELEKENVLLKTNNIKLSSENYRLKKNVLTFSKALNQISDISISAKEKEEKFDDNIITPVQEKIKTTIALPAKIKEQHQITQESIKGGEKSILIACASYLLGLRRDQLTVMTGYKRSSRDVFIARLKAKDLIEQVGDRLKATRAGISSLGNYYEKLPVGTELQNYWLQRLSGGEKEILNVLITAFPGSITREQISDKTDYKRSSRDVFISRLLARELVTIPEKGYIKASEQLFDI